MGDEASSFYHRDIPENFSSGKDDLLMRSLIKNYAVEGKKDDGSGPNGHFFLTRSAAAEAANEVVGSHFGWKGEKRNNYVNS